MLINKAILSNLALKTFREAKKYLLFLGVYHLAHVIVNFGKLMFAIYIEGGAQLSGIAQKLANNKKSTIFIQSSSYLRVIKYP